jgi:hypothetical protein
VGYGTNIKLGLEREMKTGTLLEVWESPQTQVIPGSYVVITKKYDIGS